MKVVIDSSYALAMTMPDEAAPASAPIVLTGDMLAPFIWPIEVASGALNAVRRKRMPIDQAQATTVAVQAFGVDVRPEVSESASYYFQLANRYGLTPWDALYVDLALKGQYELATKDEAMIAVAERLGLTVHQRHHS